VLGDSVLFWGRQGHHRGGIVWRVCHRTVLDLELAICADAGGFLSGKAVMFCRSWKTRFRGSRDHVLLSTSLPCSFPLLSFSSRLTRIALLFIPNPFLFGLSPRLCYHCAPVFVSRRSLHGAQSGTRCLCFVLQLSGKDRILSSGFQTSCPVMSYNASKPDTARRVE